MYKSGSDSHQTALFRGKLADWVNGDEILSAEDQLRQLQRGAQLLEARILAAPKGSDERRALGQEKLALQWKIKTLRDDRPQSPVEWKSHFVNEAKRILSPSQWEMIYNAAKISASREEGNRKIKRAEQFRRQGG